MPVFFARERRVARPKKFFAFQAASYLSEIKKKKKECWKMTIFYSLSQVV